MTFKPGQSGNPAGPRTGSKHRVTLAVEKLMDGEAKDITRKAIELAKAGDVTAIRLCLERIAPARKSRPVRFTLPALNGPDDLPTAIAGLLRAASEGELSPDEVSALAGALDGWRRSVELTELANELAELKATVAAMRRRTGDEP